MSAAHSALAVSRSATVWGRIGTATSRQRRSPGSVGAKTGASAPITAPRAGSLMVAEMLFQASWE